MYGRTNSDTQNCTSFWAIGSWCYSKLCRLSVSMCVRICSTVSTPSMPRFHEYGSSFLKNVSLDRALQICRADHQSPAARANHRSNTVDQACRDSVERGSLTLFSMCRLRCNTKCQTSSHRRRQWTLPRFQYTDPMVDTLPCCNDRCLGYRHPRKIPKMTEVGEARNHQ